jgi:uncharacterized protein
MKKIIPIILALLIVSCKKEEIIQSITKEFSIHSNSTNANYTIKIALPDNYNPSKQKYATIYVLDGDDNFNFVAVNCKKISSDQATTNVIVVSIGYGNDRSVDYTPTAANEGGGGGEKFMKFIREELIPRIQSDYAADTLRESRTILGHSFGGLLAAFAFTNYNDVFGNYILLSPSLWYDNEILLHFEQEHRNVNSKNHQFVFMGMGGMENSGRMFAHYEAFRQHLQSNYPSIKIASHMEQHLDHMGSKNPNILEGLKFYFQNR